jgi:hypothetical protein
MTDAAIGERAECVMLNKGPFILEVVTIWDDVLSRMQAHRIKKSPQQRALFYLTIDFKVRTYAGKGRAKRCRLKLEGRILAKKDEL